MNYDELFGGEDDFSAPVGVDLSNVNLSDFNLGDIASGFSGDIGNLGITPDFLSELNANPDLLRAFQAEFPDDFNAIKDIINVGNLETDDAVVTDRNQIVSTSGDVQESMDSPDRGAATNQTTNRTTNQTTNKKGILGTDITATDAAKYAAMLAMAKLAYDDAQRAREEARGWSAPGGYSKRAVRGPSGGVSFKKAASGGIMSLQGGGALRDEMINTRIRQLNPTTGPQGAGADYVNFVKNKAKQDVSKFENDLKTLGLTDPEALEAYASNFKYGPIYEEYEESGLDFSPRLNARTDETANVIRALATPSTQARSDYEANISELASEPTYDIGIPQLYEGNIPSVMLNPEYDFSGEMSNKDLATAAMPTGYLTQEDEEELGSNYSGLMALLAPKMGEDVTQMRAAGGGIGSLDMARGGRTLPPRYLNGHSDGMADKVPANIDGKRPAALSDGEFVIPADVVSHLGNGNSNAGAKRLYKMMDDIRAARTGNPKQGKQINPDKFMPR